MKRLLQPLILSFICWGLWGFLGCTWKDHTLHQKVVLKVESQTMTSRQFADALATQLSRYDALTAKDPRNVKRVKSAIVDDFILTAILKNWAEKNGIQVDPTLVEKEAQRVREGFPDDFSFREELSRQGQSVVEWQRNIEVRLLEKKVFEKIQEGKSEPSFEEIKAFYEANKQKYKHPEKILLQQIVLSEQSDADQIQSALKDKKSFESLAKNFSIAPEGKKGGVVGWVEKGTLDVFDQAFSLPVGVVSATLQSPYGFHILKVQKKMPGGVASLESVYDAIKRELRAQKDQAYFSAWLDQQIRSVHVFKDQVFIDALRVETRNE